MGELAVGDFVFDEKGLPTRVSFASEVMHDRPCYLVKFSDGSEIVADEDHEWMSVTKVRRKHGRKAIKVTTKVMASSLRAMGETNHAISVCKPVQYPERDLPIHPYVLGVWLGDGSSNCSDISKKDLEVVDRVRSFGRTVHKKKHRYMWCIDGLITDLKKLGVAGNKHVPAIYMTASVEQRQYLLAGLMDTDGFASREKGWCEFSSVRKGLAESVRELVASLGFKSTLKSKRMKLNGRDVGEAWRVCFCPTRQVFLLPRKAARLEGLVRKPCLGFRFVMSVTPVESRPVRCIQVESPSHLYLAGKDYIPTHNTLLGSVMVLVGHGPYRNGQFKFPGATSGGNIWWVTKDFPTGQKVWRDLKASLVKWNGTLDKSEVEHRIGFPGGGSIAIKSADNPDSLRGETLHGVVFDECAMCDEEAWSQALRPTLIRHRGWAVLISTPKGYNWFHDEYLIGADGKNPDYRSWRRPSSDNPTLNPDDLEKERLLVGTYNFRQEYMAEFEVKAGGMFKYEWFRTYKVQDGMFYPQIGEPAHRANMRFFISADFAGSQRTYSDYTVIMVWARSPDGRIWLIDMVRDKMDVPSIVPLLSKLTVQHSAESIWVEKIGPLVRINHEAREKGLPLQEINEFLDKVAKASPAAARIEQGKVLFPEGAPFMSALRTELCAFTGEKGKKDDQVDAIALGVLASPPAVAYAGTRRRQEVGGSSWWNGVRS